jgi:carbamoyl-phosphate synthase small subunit
MIIAIIVGMVCNNNNKAYLVLSTGEVFEGKSFGASGCVSGEAVFTTGMTGYLETLTDPSYYGQIVMQTFPLIGNYGVIPSDFESNTPSLSGYIVRQWCTDPSNFRMTGDLDAYLKKNGIIGISGIDTRRLTKIIREHGVMNVRIISMPDDNDNKQFNEKLMLNNPADKENLIKSIKEFSIKKAVLSVSPLRESKREKAEEDARNGKTIVLWDFGAKKNIERELVKRGFDVVSVCAETTAAQIMALNPDGIMLSNGPGDPAENTEIITELKILCEKKIPIFGICLGHQLLALSQGAVTEKLKYGHRGANQPVKDLKTGRIYISSQNHGYTVVPETLSCGAEVSFINLNDQTCEGIRYKEFPAFSVQFHPEASAGPLDTAFLFDSFASLINMKEF